MRNNEASLARTLLIWSVLLLVLGVPIIAAGFSPQLQWRDPIYIIAGFAGVISLCLLLVQPLLIGEYLPSLSPQNYRRLHRTLSNQPSRRNRRAFIGFPHLLFYLGCHRHVGSLRHRNTSCITKTHEAKTKNMAHRPFSIGDCDYHRQRRPCLADRRHDGDDVESCIVCAGDTCGCAGDICEFAFDQLDS